MKLQLKELAEAVAGAEGLEPEVREQVVEVLTDLREAVYHATTLDDRRRLEELVEGLTWRAL